MIFEFWTAQLLRSSWRPTPSLAEKTGQYLPLELPGRFPKLAAHEWLLLVNGDVRYKALPEFGGHFQCPHNAEGGVP